MDVSKKSLTVEELYNKWPYPKYSWLDYCFSKIDKSELPLMNYEGCFDGVYGGVHRAARKPKVLVVGCGTFEAIVVQKANPGADILAIDLSEGALKKLQQAKKIYRISKGLQIEKKNFLDIQETFDFIIATGVLHHLPKPEEGFRHLHFLLRDQGIARVMVYSSVGRSYLYEMKKYFSLLGVDTPKKIKKAINNLPGNHPYKIYFHLYGDTKNENGIADGFLHPIDHPFTALELKNILECSNLELGMSLQSHIELPKEILDIFEDLSYWQRLHILDTLSLLRENFRFVLRKKEHHLLEQSSDRMIWNPILKKTKANIYSRLLGKKVYVNTAYDPGKYPLKEIEELRKAKFLLRG